MMMRNVNPVRLAIPAPAVKRDTAKSPSPGWAFCFENHGAGKEGRTLDLYLGKVSLYQLSYSRMVTTCVIDWLLGTQKRPKLLPIWLTIKSGRRKL